MRLVLESLQEGHRTDFDFQSDPEAIDLDKEVFETVIVSGTARVARDGVLLELSASADAHLVCDRTAEKFVQKIEASATALATESSVERDDTEVLELDVASRSVDLTKLIHDILILAIPARKIAPGAEDVDIQAKYGESEDEIDPRWAPLMKHRRPE